MEESINEQLVLPWIDIQLRNDEKGCPIWKNPNILSHIFFVPKILFRRPTNVFFFYVRSQYFTNDITTDWMEETLSINHQDEGFRCLFLWLARFISI
ncbi:hypothetical protein CEXT_279131 [Caerostris extrusa]|uniref:Uncharacterized protein n=1 Tax=Caerostris extrusa TaxID=172846 RepID=A0AAV4XK26_CAEEX|nr:hypothetical protein CEXT_279131 [Caerostris extrusa]